MVRISRGYSMSERLFTVDEVSLIEGRGTVVCGFKIEQYGRFRKGDEVVLRRPNGSTIKTKIAGVEYPPSITWLEKRPENPSYGILVEPPITRDDVPIGTEVWSRE